MRLHRLDVGGYRLAVAEAGPTGGPAAVVLHGFTGSAATMAPVTGALAAAGHRVLAPDLVGHGRTDAPPDVRRYSIAAAVGALAGALTALEVVRCAVVGYSMGGRVALHWAAGTGGADVAVERLVTIGASPGLLAPDERAARVADDEELANRIEARGADWFADWWAARPLFATQTGRVAPALADVVDSTRRAADPQGLANSLRGMGTGAMAPLDEAMLAAVDAPTLVLAGADDDKFVRVGRRLAAALPEASFAAVPGAGHAAHLEAPGPVTDRIAAFLADD